MKNLSLKTVLRGILLPLFLIAADQFTKAAAVRSLKGAQPSELLPGVLGLSYVENRGMSFDNFFIVAVDGAEFLSVVTACFSRFHFHHLPIISSRLTDIRRLAER